MIMTLAAMKFTNKPTNELTSGVSKICLTCSMLTICHVYLVKVPSGRASFLTKAVVKLGSRFFLLPVEILCWRQSKKN